MKISNRPARTTPDSWGFRSKFRRGAFGWRGSKLAIERIGEALAEIRGAQRRDPVAAAQGAVLLLQRLSPALSQVDSSSGALGSAAHAAVRTLVPIIASAPVCEPERMAWLEKLFEALQEDDPRYIESLADHWGELCVIQQLASSWADRLAPTVQRVLQERQAGVFAWFAGTGACYSALFKAGRHAELLELLDLTPRPGWHDLVWGGRVLVARGAVDEAIEFLVRRGGVNTPPAALARFAEEALLQAGRRVQAYERYAIAAHQANSRLATYRAIAKTYPEIEPERLLRDLMESTPGEEGKWFATAKSLKRYELAIELAWMSPCDPKTLTRAARDHLNEQPAFAAQAAMAAMHWMATGHGYELTGIDVLEALRHGTEAARRLGQEQQVQQRQTLATDHPAARWMRQVVGIA
jgi:hypothetical protein